MELRFKPGLPMAGRLMYVRNDHTFLFEAEQADFTARMHGPRSTLCVSTLQLEASCKSGLIVDAWGYWPLENQKRARLQPPEFKAGTVLVSGVELDAGIGISVGTHKEWKTTVDDDNNLVKIRRGLRGAKEHIEFATGCILGLRDGRLVEIWLRPEFVDDADMITAP